MMSGLPTGPLASRLIYQRAAAPWIPLHRSAPLIAVEILSKRMGPALKILDHIGESTQPPRIAPARGPPLWEAAAAKQAENDPQWDQAAQPRPEVEFDQRIAW